MPQGSSDYKEGSTFSEAFLLFCEHLLSLEISYSGSASGAFFDVSTLDSVSEVSSFLGVIGSTLDHSGVCDDLMVHQRLMEDVYELFLRLFGVLLVCLVHWVLVIGY